MDHPKIPSTAVQAIPIGLIVKEATTNAIKHAFPFSGTGEICISLKYKARTIQLSIKDNGIGLLQSTSSFITGTLGMKLMKDLAEEVRGEFRIESEGGTGILIAFTHEHLFLKKVNPHSELIDSRI